MLKKTFSDSFRRFICLVCLQSVSFLPHQTGKRGHCCGFLASTYFWPASAAGIWVAAVRPLTRLGPVKLQQLCGLLHQRLTGITVRRNLPTSSARLSLTFSPSLPAEAEYSEMESCCRGNHLHERNTPTSSTTTTTPS